MIRYRFGDLVLESEVALPSLPIAEDASAEYGFLLVRASDETRYRDTCWDHHWRGADGSISLSCAKVGAGYRLGVPGLATFSIGESGREVRYAPESDLPAVTLEHLLLDQVLPRVLAWRGRAVLHAGCVASGRDAILFLGESGTGKSTLCAAFARAGWTLLGDDAVVARRSEAGGFEVAAAYPGLRLLPLAMSRLFEGAEVTPVAHYTGKRRVASISVDAAPRPLRTIYLLESANAGDGRVRSTPVQGREAFLALVRSAFQLHLDDPVEGRAMFERLGELAGRVPVRSLSYPRTFDLLPQVIAEVGRTAFPPAATR